MRAILTSFGSTGNTQPVLALAVQLRRRGHQPILALHPSDASRAKQLGFDFVPLANFDPNNGRPGTELLTGLVSDPTKYSSLDYMHAVAENQARAMPVIFKRLSDIVGDADILVSTANLPVARMVHEITGVPFAAFHTFYLQDSDTELGAEGNPVYRQVSELYVNRFREELGLPPLTDPMTRNGNSPQLTMFAISRHVAPQPAGWPAHYHMPGYFFLDDDWKPDRELLEFLDAGEKPVVISFGSIPYANPDEVINTLVEAIRLSGFRAIIQRGSSGLGRKTLPEQILAADYVPHWWLFPRAACVVHHSGSGTTAAVFRAGVPSVCVPHLFDQPIWAKVVHQLGCTGPPIRFSELSPGQLAAAIAAEANNENHRKTAQTLGERIRSEDGVQRACELIEELVKTVELRVG